MDANLRKLSFKKIKIISILCLVIAIFYIAVGIIDYNFKYQKPKGFVERGILNTYDEFYEKYDDNKFTYLYSGKEEKLLEKWIIDKKIAQYNINIIGLKSVLVNIIILVTLGALVIFYRPKGIEVSFVKLKIPEELLYIIVAFGLLYTWSNFGLEFNSALDSRLSLHHNLKSVIGDSIYSEMNYEQKPIHILADNALIDNWCTFFLTYTKEKNLIKISI